MSVLIVALVLALSSAAAAEEISLPPGERPVRVSAGFFLVNLSDLSERSETFAADVYIRLRWKDSRLAFAGSEPHRFVEDGAIEQLDRIWWPDIEFVNTSEPDITNRSLQIFPDGTVAYEIGMSAEFRTDLDLRSFPFDTQRLEIRIESFLWTAEQVVFVADPQLTGFAPESTFEGLAITAVAAEVRSNALGGWDETYSQYAALIEVERRAGFYLWTVFAPVCLIFLTSCTVFVVDYRNFHDRVGISLAALLACIATQFAISFNLPQISYLTLIDRGFLVTYACVALGVLVSTAQAALLRDDPARAGRVDRLAGFGLPVVYLILLLIFVRP